MQIKTGNVFFVIFIWMTVFVHATELKRDGWNLISICEDIDKSDINMTGIEEIQNQDGLSIYTGEFSSSSNLDVLEAGYGYWVKGNVGTRFDSKESMNRLAKPLTRSGWNLMASCEETPRNEVNMSGIEEIQNQDGLTIYTGEWKKFSNLDVLENGYGYWIKGVKGDEYISKKGLSVPKAFTQYVINNRGDVVEKDYKGYQIKLYSDSNVTANAQVNHVGVVVKIDGEEILMQIQESYLGSNIVVAVYDGTGKRLIGITESTVINGNTIIPVAMVNQRIDNHPPIFTQNLFDINLSLGSNYSFHIDATDLDNDGLEYEWSIDSQQGDSRGLDFTYKFDTIGIFTVKCQVSDGDLIDISEAKIRVEDKAESIGELNGKAEIKGVLSNANVRIFKIESNGSKALLYQDWTNQYGEFNTHKEALEDNEFYIYELSGGVDISNSMRNRGVLHAIVDGAFVKSNDFTVSVLSEMLYIFSAKDTSYNYNVTLLKNSLNRHTATLLSEDIDGNGEINYFDALLFDYQNERSSLNQLRYSHIESLLKYIYNNRGLLFAENILYPLIGNFDTSGYSKDVSLSKDGTKAFIADQNQGLKIIDISNPVAPFLIEKFEISNANSVTLLANERRAYVSGSAGVSVVDISDVHNLSLVSRLDLNGASNLVMSHDESKIFVTNTSSSSFSNIKVIDIGDDTNLSIVKTLSYSSYDIGRVVLSKDDSKVFMVEDKFYILDISDVSKPTTVGIVKKEGRDVSFSNTRDMVISQDETKVFVLDSSGLRIVNITDLSTPTVMGTFKTIGNAFGLTLSQDEKKVFIADGYRGVKVLDISNPYKPYLIGNVDTYNAQKIKLSTDESKAYVADERKGLKIIDIRDLVNPLLPVKNFNTFGEAWSLVLSQDEEKLFVAEKNLGFETIDISNPLDLQLLGKFDTYVQDLVLSMDGNRAFVATGSQFKVIDISNPANRVLIGIFDIPANKIMLSRDNSKAFVLGSEGYDKGEFTVIDIQDPLHMNLVDSFSLSSPPQNMTLSKDGTKAFITYYSFYSKGMQVIDISNPSNLSSLSRFSSNDTYFKGITLSADNTKAFIASGTQGIQVLDIAKSSEVSIIGSLDTMIDDAQMLILSADNTKAFVADGYGGVKIIDITNLSRPSLLGRFDTIGYANMIVLSKDESRIYVADKAGGIQIIDLNILSLIKYKEK